MAGIVAGFVLTLAVATVLMEVSTPSAASMDGQSNMMAGHTMQNSDDHTNGMMMNMHSGLSIDSLNHVDNVDVIGVSITGEDTISVLLRQTVGTTTSPVTVAVHANGHSTHAHDTNGTSDSVHQASMIQLAGSTVSENWTSSTPIAVNLIGQGSALDADKIMVHVNPYTGT